MRDVYAKYIYFFLLPPSIFHKAADWSLFEAADELDATVKFGIKYVNWRKHDIFSHVQPPAYGMHLNNFKIKERIRNHNSLR